MQWPQNTMIPADWREKYATKVPDELEVIGASFWDRQTYTSGTTVGLNFFDAIRANALLGNIRLPGMMQQDESFAILAVRFGLVSQQFSSEAEVADETTIGDVMADNEALILNGFFRLNIQNKGYIENPLFMLPLGGGVHGQFVLQGVPAAGAAQGGSWAMNGIPDPRAVFTLTKPVVLPPLTRFPTRAEWPTAQTLAGGNQDVIVILDGELIRPKQ